MASITPTDIEDLMFLHEDSWGPFTNYFAMLMQNQHHLMQEEGRWGGGVPFACAHDVITMQGLSVCILKSL